MESREKEEKFQRMFITVIKYLAQVDKFVFMCPFTDITILLPFTGIYGLLPNRNSYTLRKSVIVVIG